MKKISKHITIIMIFTTAFVLTNCTGIKPPEIEQSMPRVIDPQTKTLNILDFFPLSEGSSWQYLGEGNEFASFKRKVLYVEGNRAQVIEHNGGTVSASVYNFSKEEIVRTYFAGEEYTEENRLIREPNDNFIILKAPLKVGTKWETPEGTREIVDINAIVDTSIVKYIDCVKVSSISDNTTYNEYFKAGIGMVKREFIFGGFIITSVLEQFDIK